ncbi:hypothetical protein D1007_38966 [Hordeum vulgare]|nr:hypothetical protein D1007_38966 [Hordeum vulgare]
MRSLADELAAAGKPLDEHELIPYIGAGLDIEYQPLVSALDACVEPVTLDELFAQMSNFDQRVALFQGANTGGFKSSANAATRGHSGRGRGTNHDRGNYTIPPLAVNAETSVTSAATVICGKLGHLAKDCWYLFDDDGNSSQDDKVAEATDRSYGVDTNWYMDSGATNHITGELEKVTMRDGKDNIHTASGEGSGNEEGAISR